MSFSECELNFEKKIKFVSENFLDSTANDIAELVVEQASDFRMSDFLDESNNQQQQQQNAIAQNVLPNPVINVPQRKNSDVGLIAGEFSIFLRWFST